MARWRVRLSPSAQRDLAGIIDYSVEAFGVRHARIYRTTLETAISALRAGPDLPGSIDRGDLAAGLRSLHVARKGRRGRHILIYRQGDQKTVEVVRILHDAMDLGQHVEPSGDEER